LNVYPAANILDYVPFDCPIYLIDPNPVTTVNRSEIQHIKQKAGIGVPALVKKYL
jgi:NAD-dependent deacetylase